jgi:sugar/nucleoside kinase (ribokinase family)
VAQPLIVTFGDVLALALITPPSGVIPEASTPVDAEVIVGGQAALTAYWVVEAGARARTVGARAFDRLGDLVEGDLTERGIELVGPGVEGRTGLVTVVRPADGARTALADRGVSPQISADALEEGWFADADLLHVSGYALLDQPAAGAAERAVELARAAGARISVDLACADAVSPLVRQRIADLHADVALATDRQAQAIDGIDDLAAFHVRSDERAVVPPSRSMGVGDAFAGGFLSAFAMGGAVEDAVLYGRELASRCAETESPLP